MYSSASGLGVYSGGGSGGSGGYQTTGTVPYDDDPWWEDAFSWLGSLIGSEYPKPLPPPLPFTVADVKAMFAQLPNIKRAVVQKMKGQGHTAIYLGSQPTAATWSDPQLVAELALWFANGTGDDLSRGEAEIRRLVLSGMRQVAPSSWTGGGSGGGGGGGGGSGGGGGVPGDTQATVGALVGLALLGAGIYMATR